MTITLKRSQYRILNAPAPPRWRVVAMAAGILATSLAWAVLGLG